MFQLIRSDDSDAPAGCLQAQLVAQKYQDVSKHAERKAGH